MLKEHFNNILAALLNACRQHYGARLVSVAVFGSVARGTMRPDSDIDLLLVVDGLPAGRMNRVREFMPVEEAVSGVLAAAEKDNIHTSLSIVFKTPEELQRGSLLFLDMTDQAVILYDKENILRNYLDDLTRRLKAMGARRIYRRGGYYWLLKPDLKPGEKIQL